MAPPVGEGGGWAAMIDWCLIILTLGTRRILGANSLSQIRELCF